MAISNDSEFITSFFFTECDSNCESEGVNDHTAAVNSTGNVNPAAIPTVVTNSGTLNKQFNT